MCIRDSSCVLVICGTCGATFQIIKERTSGSNSQDSPDSRYKIKKKKSLKSIHPFLSSVFKESWVLQTRSGSQFPNHHHIFLPLKCQPAYECPSACQLLLFQRVPFIFAVRRYYLNPGSGPVTSSSGHYLNPPPS